MNCENCNIEHDGSYGSGRFCNSVCARAFSTKNKRKEINEKVSKKLKNRPSEKKGKPGKKHSSETRKKVSDALKKHYKDNPQKRRTVAQKRASNVAKVLAYRARKRKAIPQDSDMNLIKKIYEHCPKGYHVDHIISLARGGLHHQDNLQYLPISENCRKCADRAYDSSLAISWKTILGNLA